MLNFKDMFMSYLKYVLLNTGLRAELCGVELFLEKKKGVCGLENSCFTVDSSKHI